jgi:hypothetical protein
LAAGATQCSLPHSERDELGLSEDDGSDNQTCVFLRRYTKDKSCWEQNKCRYPPSHFSLPPSEEADFFMCKLTPDRKVMQGGAICGLQWIPWLRCDMNEARVGSLCSRPDKSLAGSYSTDNRASSITTVPFTKRKRTLMLGTEGFSKADGSRGLDRRLH